MNQFLKDPLKIKAWLEKANIVDFEMFDSPEFGYIVNVYQDVDITEKKLTSFPFKFGVIQGHFLCFDNLLTNLYGGPDEVYGHFQCGNNKLTHLEFCPKIVEEEFGCSDNVLTSLKHSPSKVGGFFCRNNQLTSLEGCPQIINGRFFCNHNKIDTLLYFPSFVKNQIMINNNPSLGELQYCTQFNVIYEEHLKQKIPHDFNCKLNLDLNSKDNFLKKIKI